MAKLTAFKAMSEHGHCDVPWGYAANIQLGKWANTQRTEKTKYDADSATSQLTAERVGKLEALGFVWDPYVAKWEKMLAELAAFKDVHGHCNVPQRYQPNRQLGTWVSRQRQNQALTMERVRKLKALGFVFSMPVGRPPSTSRT